MRSKVPGHVGTLRASVFLGFAFAASLMCEATAEQYPSRPIKVISPFSAGSAPDVMARLVWQQLSDRAGWSVTIDNRPGAGTTIGTKAGAAAEPDGYTLLQTATSLMYAPVLYPNVGYDPIKSFAPVASIARWSHVLVISANLPANTIDEFIAYAKANPGQVNIG